jgi:hypothetical protein
MFEGAEALVLSIGPGLIGSLAPINPQRNESVHCLLIAHHGVDATRERLGRLLRILKPSVWRYDAEINLREPFHSWNLGGGLGQTVDCLTHRLQHDDLFGFDVLNRQLKRLEALSDLLELVSSRWRC